MNIEKLIEKNRCEYLVWNESYSRIIGVARVEIGEDKAEIKVINVENSYRGNGIGTKLLKKIVDDFSDKKIFTWTFEEREEWYKRNGFEAIARDGKLQKLRYAGEGI